MKTQLTFIFSILMCLSLSLQLNAQGNIEDDQSNYWILENFNQFDIEEEWNILQKNYKTYPNNINLSAIFANVEQGFDCAYGQKSLRIRGLEENGAAEFTVPNASWVRIYITGKQKAADRGVVISINGEEVFREEGFDRYKCIEFAQKVDSEEPVTVKITAADETKKDPIVLYYVEVQKYGIDIPKEEAPQPSTEGYWIYEDFLNMEVEADYNTTKDYLSAPNNIVLSADSASIELGEGCSGGGGKKNLRIRGRQYVGGSVEFKVPNAKSVSINLTGKSTLLDRTVQVYKNNELVKTFNNLDRTTCVEFLDEEPSKSEVIYKIVGGNNTDKPVAITSIYVEKYDFSDIDIVEDVDVKPIYFYPNPAKDVICFNEAIQSANVFELNGRLVAKANNALDMNVANLSSGTYIVQLVTKAGEVTTHKLVKE